MKKKNSTYYPAWLINNEKAAQASAKIKKNITISTISVKNLQTKAVEPDNFYKPISKIF
jgi:hypothetical protein